jgi:mono/diheme cytochrome c family protein
MKNTYKIVLFIVAFIGLIQSCSKKMATQSNSLAQNTEGLELMKTSCFSCHSPKEDFENRLAPPMIAIKRHYITEGVSKKEFVKAVTAFVQKPTVEKSKMPNAVKRFGVMPAMAFSEEQLRKIAEYIYDADIEKPDWFEQHHKEEQDKHKHGVNHSEQNTLNFGEQGAKYAMMAKSVLGKNLLDAINTKGVDEALAFCNLKAIPLTDSVATAQKVGIKRVSDKPRNPKNQAASDELAYIEEAKTALAKGEKPLPKTQEINGKMIGYYPIETNTMCLKCHGKPESDIKTTTLEKIGKYYPMDKAVGYGENQIRGIFVVEMNK